MTSDKGKSAQFQAFLKDHAGQARTREVEERILTAFGINTQFHVDFKNCRRFLLADKSAWGDEVILYLTRQNALPASFEAEDAKWLRARYAEHQGLFRSGKFDGAYLNSVERIGMFLAFHKILPIWVIGAYREMAARLIDVMCGRAGLNQRIPLRETMRALNASLALETHQLQRTFLAVERRANQVRAERAARPPSEMAEG